jgi:hypothetical protein
MGIYQFENVIQFNFFYLKSINQIDLINFWQFLNSIIHIALVIFKYLVQLTKLLINSQLSELIAIQIPKYSLV